MRLPAASRLATLPLVLAAATAVPLALRAQSPEVPRGFVDAGTVTGALAGGVIGVAVGSVRREHAWRPVALPVATSTH